VTALGTTKMREAMQGTNALRTTGTAHLLAAARAVGAHRFLTQSNVFGYGYRDHGPHTISEDDPLAEPESGPLGPAIATMRSNEEQVFSADEMEYPDAAQAGCCRSCSWWRTTRASGTVVSMLGESSNWLRNVRAAGGRAVLRHDRREAVRLEEVDADARAPVVHRYLSLAPGPRAFIPVDPDAPSKISRRSRLASLSFRCNPIVQRVAQERARRRSHESLHRWTMRGAVRFADRAFPGPYDRAATRCPAHSVAHPA
jgi:hypothetical protein